MSKYIYGVISTSQPLTFGQSLLSSSPREVYTVVHRELAGVVSNYDGSDLASLGREEKLRCLMSHQWVIEWVMKEGYTILPVKFGTLVEDEDEIRRILEQGYNKLVPTLNQMNGLVEIEVAATWDLKKVLEEIGGEAQIRQLGRSMAGKLVKESLDRRRKSYRNQTMQSLARTALDVQLNALVADEMVMNIAFLIQRERQVDFDGQVRRINQALDDQINFRVIGPLPPYSFSTVEIKRPDPDKIEEARQLLGLGTKVSDKELKEAYRHLAARNHPTVHPDETGDEQWAKVREAFILLRGYCHGQDEGLEEKVNGQCYSLKPEDVSQAFLIEVKRPAPPTG
jgi:hypothetical protein